MFRDIIAIKGKKHTQEDQERLHYKNVRLAIKLWAMKGEESLGNCTASAAILAESWKRLESYSFPFLHSLQGTFRFCAGAAAAAEGS